MLHVPSSKSLIMLPQTYNWLIVANAVSYAPFKQVNQSQ